MAQPDTCNVSGTVSPNSNLNPPFDECPSTGTYTSALAKALDAIIAINTDRYNATPRLQKLRLSIGLKAGIDVPLTYILPGSSQFLRYQDIATTFSTMGNQKFCGRLPDVWSTAYIAAYDAALDELLRYINAYDGGVLNGTVRVIKVAPFNVDSVELNMGGRMGGIMVSGEPFGTDTNGQGPLMSCPTSSGAYEWLTEYNTNAYNVNDHAYLCDSYVSIIQASQCVVGMSLGHMQATLYNNNVQEIELSINQSNGNIYPDIQCGYGGTDSCAVQTNSMDQWSQYNFFETITGLFTQGSPVYNGHSYGFKNHSYDGSLVGLMRSNIITEWTGLTIDPQNPILNDFSDGTNTKYNANAQLTCGLNNTSTAHPASFQLFGVPYPPAGTTIVGVGVLNSWQTLSDTQSAYCTAFSNQANEYDAILKSGYLNSASEAISESRWNGVVWGLASRGGCDCQQVFEALLETSCGPRPAARSIAALACAMEVI